jgi:hypothetical protein
MRLRLKMVWSQAREDCDDFVDKRIADKCMVVVVLVSRIVQELRGELLTSCERV